MKPFLFQLLQLVALELLAVFGIFFVLGYILYRIQKATHQQYIQTIGWYGLYLTAWIGTPIHEIMHIFFAKLFGHTIEHVSLFQPNKETGGLGHVEHSYHKHSIVQRLGLFFIGAAPLIGGALSLVTMLFFLVPNGKEVIDYLSLPNYTSVLTPVAIVQASFTLFHMDNLRNPWFWLFLYISFCIVSHMAPSTHDRKNMYKGLFSIIVLLLLVNSILLIAHIDISGMIYHAYIGNTFAMAFFLYVLILSVTHYLVSFIIFFIPFQIRKRIRRR